jgi:hypothetical protein
MANLLTRPDKRIHCLGCPSILAVASTNRHSAASATALYLCRIRRPVAIVLALVFGVLTIAMFTAAVQSSTVRLSTVYWYKNDLEKIQILITKWNDLTKLAPRRSNAPDNLSHTFDPADQSKPATGIMNITKRCVRALRRSAPSPWRFRLLSTLCSSGNRALTKIDQGRSASGKTNLPPRLSRAPARIFRACGPTAVFGIRPRRLAPPRLGASHTLGSS